MSTIKTKSISHPSSTDNLTLNSNGSISVGNSTVNTSISTNSTAVSIGGVLNYDNSATANSIFVDANGYVLKPNNPSFKVYTGGDQSLPTNATHTTLDFDNVAFDTESGFNTSTNRYTIPVTGYWYLEAHTHFTSNLTGYSYCFIDFKINGSASGGEEMMPRPGGGTFTGVSKSDIYSLDVNDYVEVYVVQSGGSSMTCRGGFRRFRGYLIG